MAQTSVAQFASELKALAGPSSVDVKNGNATITFALPRQAVSLLVLEW